MAIIKYDKSYPLIEELERYMIKKPGVNTSVLILIIIIDLFFGVGISAEYREGDILYALGASPTGHVGIIVKDNYGQLVVREANKESGIVNTPMDEFCGRYSEVDLLRVNVDDATAQRAAEFAKAMEGPYGFTGEENWYCSELVSSAYKSADVDLVTDPYPLGMVSPSQIAGSEQIESTSVLSAKPPEPPSINENEVTINPMENTSNENPSEPATNNEVTENSQQPETNSTEENYYPPDMGPDSPTLIPPDQWPL